MDLTGPDVSNLQGDVDMRAVRADGHTFVGIKVAEGGDYLDSCFQRNRQHAADAELIRLLYHFGRPGNGRGFPIGDPRAAIIEAHWFLRCLLDHGGNLQPGEVVMLDLEDGNVPAGVDLGPWSLAFLAEVDRVTGRAGGSPDDDAGEYTYGPYATGHLRFSTQLGTRRLWLAAYNTSPTVPAPWRDWTFHQFTSSGTCPGIVGRCDLSRFVGPLDALQRIAALTPQSAPPTSAPPTKENLIMSVAQSDDDARRTLIRQWCQDYWGHGAMTVEDQNILAYWGGFNPLDLVLAHIADHPKADAFRAAHAA